MQKEERKELRFQLLSELYQHHFAEKGLSKQIDIRVIEQDPETHLAYHYLMEKNYIVVKHYDRFLTDFKITAYGMDVIETDNHSFS